MDNSTHQTRKGTTNATEKERGQNRVARDGEIDREREQQQKVISYKGK